MNIKFLTVLTIFSSLLFSQVSVSDIERLTNQQLDKIRNELQSKAESAIVDEVAPIVTGAPNPVSITSTAVSMASGDYFGYNYLRKDISFFDNIPTPADYRLGPGDEIIISLWGETNSRSFKVINKDGMIYFDNIGFINISNHTLESAEEMLAEELSRIYSTLKDKDKPSKLMLSLGKLKSMNIYFSGYIENPGINLIHPFSDIFSAIVQAGGVNDKGSLRKIQLIRNNKTITTVDFYSFFMNGINSFSNLKLVDGDVIHIPKVDKRVSIEGAITRPGTFELLSNESTSDLINFASELTNTASTTFIYRQVIPSDERDSDDNARLTSLLNIKDIDKIVLNDGDSITINSISTIKSGVIVYGNVKSPGSYPANNVSLKSILDLAGGFNDPNFRPSILDDQIVILRKDKENYYSKEFTFDYDSSDNIQLTDGDRIFVYEDINYRNKFIFRINGQVMKPGSYPLVKDRYTLQEAIDDAGGLTQFGSLDAITASKSYSFIDKNGDIISVDDVIRNLSPDFNIENDMEINVATVKNVIRVSGNVYSPGIYAHNGSLSYSRAIGMAGGFKPKSDKKRAYIVRLNGKTEKVGGFGKFSKKINPGDQVVIPVKDKDREVNISGLISDLAATIANLTAIFILIENIDD